MAADKAAPLIFWAWSRRLAERLFADEIGAENWERSGRSFRDAMENVLSAYYTMKHVDAVLSPYDGLSIGILAALKSVGYGTGDTKIPVISGQDA